MSISKKLWGNWKGREVYLFRLENAHGYYVELSNYGATIVSVNVPDKQGRLQNVVLGFNSLDGYLQDDCYIGGTIGPFANRIANARFTLDGSEYLLEANDGANTNHSASAGFNNKLFDYVIKDDVLTFKYLSVDMDGGYPGNLDFCVIYHWTVDNELKITYRATTDKKTVVNFTNHAYFNLSGTSKKIFDHRLTVHSDKVVEADDDYIPTGEIIPTSDLSFDDTRIADRMTGLESHIKGLNVCYALEVHASKEEQCAAVLYESVSARKLTVYTTFPGLMLYTGAYLSSGTPGNQHVNYEAFDGLCLECQYFPDSPNHAHFPSTVLLPDELFEEKITYKFSTQQ